jgi:hypothetical protein
MNWTKVYRRNSAWDLEEAFRLEGSEQRLERSECQRGLVEAGGGLPASVAEPRPDLSTKT